MEDKYDEFATAHNDLATNVEQLSTQLKNMEEKLIDMEDRSHRNNLRLRGIPEEIPNDDLPSFIRGCLKAHAPEIPTDMLLIDRMHRIPKPRHIPPMVPRDILLRAHYFHVKEHILRSCRTRARPPEEYATIRIYADLSAATLRRRKEFSQVTGALRAHGIRYKWGFPTKLIITKEGKTTVIQTPEDGEQKLQGW
ncbi:Hypothetical predicted protein [Pelobates cultripes]|uniref:Uncharacterized protein n=1 Tax=Pelobates cultripes TaxID=61616 RepID=A0AAD1SNY9_PELCU|nr:Hypothetical predicted protein [Pelobates cultripes]